MLKVWRHRLPMTQRQVLALLLSADVLHGFYFDYQFKQTQVLSGSVVTFRPEIGALPRISGMPLAQWHLS